MADSNKELTLNYQIKTNSLEINDRTDRFSAIGNRACQMCSMLEANETLEDLKILTLYSKILGNERFDERLSKFQLVRVFLGS